MRRDITIADSIRGGDPLEDRFRLRPAGDGLVKMFPALALRINTAKLLALPSPAWSKALAGKDGKHAQLTAIVDDDLPQDDESVSFALDTLAEQGIAIAPLAHRTGRSPSRKRNVTLEECQNRRYYKTVRPRTMLAIFDIVAILAI